MTCLRELKSYVTHYPLPITNNIQQYNIETRPWPKLYLKGSAKAPIPLTHMTSKLTFIMHYTKKATDLKLAINIIRHSA